MDKLTHEYIFMLWRKTNKQKILYVLVYIIIWLAERGSVISLMVDVEFTEGSYMSLRCSTTSYVLASRYGSTFEEIVRNVLSSKIKH